MVACVNRECPSLVNFCGRARMVRMYIRQASDKEYKTDMWKWKRYKQFFRPIGWFCPYCKALSIEKEYQEEVQASIDEMHKEFLESESES